MDRNTLIGFVLIGVIFMGFYFYNDYQNEKIYEENIEVADSLYEVKNLQEARKKYRIALSIKPEEAYPAQQINKIDQVIEPVEPQEEKKTKKNDKTSPETADVGKDSLVNEKDTVMNDSVKESNLQNLYGDFHVSAKGETKIFTLENDLLELKISSKGGRPYSARLKKYNRYDSTDVVLFSGKENAFGYKFFAQNRVINTSDLFFKAKNGKSKINVTDNPDSLTLRLYAGSDSYIEYVYTIKPGSYLVDYKINFVDMQNIIAPQTTYLELNWVFDIPSQEKGWDWENDNTAIYYKYFEDEVDDLSAKSDEESEEVTTRMKWIAYKQQFFSTVLIADEYIESGKLHQKAYEENSKYLKRFNSTIAIPYTPQQGIPMSIYFGPNKYSILKDVKEDLALQDLIPLGWGIFGWVNRFAIIPLFNFLGDFISNYGLLILVMTIIIKLVLFPLTFKSYLSSAKMRVLKPQIEELNKKIPKEKAMERQQATMGLYRKAGVNPMGGCLPMLLQLPILIAMFRFFPASIELRQKSFLWAEDLSTYDSILDLPFSIPFYGDHVSLFTLLMALSMILTTKMNSSQMDTGNNQMPGMKMMMYFMPVMLLVWFNNYSSGLSYYYFVANIITFLQTVIIRRFVDDEEVLQKLEAKKKKPKSKSKFQQRLEEAAKKQGYKPPKR